MRRLLGLALVGSALLASCGAAPPPPAYDASGLWTVEFGRPGDPDAERYIAAITMANRPNPGDFTMTLLPEIGIGPKIMAGNTVKGTVYFPNFPNGGFQGRFSEGTYDGTRTDSAGQVLETLKMTRQ